MSAVHDVAAYILEQVGPMTTMKLQKLVYYAQAWSMVWREKVLFEDEIEAWAGGPIVRSLYNSHRGRFTVSGGEIGGDPSRLAADERQAIDVVVSHYGGLTGEQLSDLTHAEPPWKNARVGLGAGERGNVVIPPSAIFEYYGSLRS